MTNHDHARFEELACLRAYGELDATGERALAGHLAECERCRRFAAELDGGLGLLAAREAQRDATELAPDWRAALELRVRAGRPRRALPLLTFAAGIAAGLLVALVTGWRADVAATDAPTSPALVIASNAAPEAAPVQFDAPPPKTTSRGQGALLAVIRGR